MKTTLTKEQSNKLLELGVPANKAYTWYLGNNPEAMNDHVFNLTDILEILPKYIEENEVFNEDKKAVIIMSYFDDTWNCTYGVLLHKDGFKCKPELIDALYELLLFVIEEGYLKF